VPSDLIAVLAEPNRRRLLALLGGGERSVTQLAAEFAVTRSAISQHLGVLMEAGLVEVRPTGRFRYYRLVPEGLAALRTEIDHFWTAEVESLAHVGPRNPEVDAVPFDKSVFVPVPPDEAFAIVTEPDRLRRWKTVASRVDLKVGGECRFVVNPNHIAAGKVVEVVPGEKFVYSWGWIDDDELPPGASTVTVTLTPGDGGTFIRLVHEGLNEAQTASHAAGWDHFLGRLVAYATTGDAGADEWGLVPDPLDELSAAYASLAACQRVAANLTAEDRPKPTPCPDLDVHGLVVHLLGSLNSLGGAAGAPASPTEGGGPERLIATAGSAALEAWGERGIDSEGEFPGGRTIPGKMAVGIIAIELLVHAWDLATATGGTVVVSDEVSDYVLGLAGTIVRPESRDGKQFGAEVDAAADADALSRLVAFTGRNP
jgi:uncharacterized protein (TIGR03086 family)